VTPDGDFCGPVLRVDRHYVFEIGTGGEEVWAEFFTFTNWRCFTCSSTTSGAMVKWMVQADSAHQIGLQLEPTLHAVLIAGC
jgi:hypothetical protein